MPLSPPAPAPDVKRAPVERKRSVPAALLFAALLAAGWLAGLAVLSWTTANPVTLNREQILRSDVVVVGRVMGLPYGPVQKVDDWPLPGGEIFLESVADLFLSNPVVGEEYILPLTKLRGEGIPLHGEYDVTETHLPNHARLIYPATPDALRQLHEILSSARR